MQIMLMTQLLKDTEETADGEPEEGAKNINLSHLKLSLHNTFPEFLRRKKFRIPKMRFKNKKSRIKFRELKSKG